MGNGMMSWRRWSEPWFLTYGLLAIIAAGVTPILLPQFINLHGNTGQVGLVMAALSLGGLTAPIWGRLAERRLHKELIEAGLIVVGVSLVLLGSSTGIASWLILALLQGAGLTAISTVAGLLIVERHPKDEWDQRMGWLMTTFGGGQVVGLMIASFFSGTKSNSGLYIGAVFAGLAFVVALRYIHTPPKPDQVRLAGPQPVRVPHVAASPGSTHHHWGHVSRQAAIKALQSPFGEFILGNSLLTLASGLIFIPYPLLFSKSYHVAPSTSSLAFGIAAALAIFWYPLAGNLSHKRGALSVLIGSLMVRWISFAALLVLAIVSTSARGFLAEASFLLTVNSWPFITVSATVAAAELAPTDEGTTMGIYNAATALVNTASALAAGLIASQFGYKGLPVFATIVMLGAVAVTIHITRKQKLAKIATSNVEAHS
jgi:DHA1 family tetracycline resistance protein-like MFS transporter